MRTLKTGEPCPCCGQPIPLTDKLQLVSLTSMCLVLGLLSEDWLHAEDGDADAE